MCLPIEVQPSPSQYLVCSGKTKPQFKKKKEKRKTINVELSEAGSLSETRDRII